ncbi:MAG: hypothetical protein LBJ23_07255 [Tannerella sp.]|jgi:hypothetical protein|nr:hypothetical protein [Tannerella sp.]
MKKAYIKINNKEVRSRLEKLGYANAFPDYFGGDVIVTYEIGLYQTIPVGALYCSPHSTSLYIDDWPGFECIEEFFNYLEN